MKRIGFEAVRNWRRAGGLYIGARLDFTTRIVYMDNETRNVVHLSIGLLAWTLRFEFRSKPV
jgi:hypothetical protein